MLTSPNCASHDCINRGSIAFGPPAQLTQLEVDMRKSMSRGCLAFDTRTTRVPVPVGRIDVVQSRK